MLSIDPDKKGYCFPTISAFLKRRKAFSETGTNKTKAFVAKRPHGNHKIAAQNAVGPICNHGWG